VPIRVSLTSRTWESCMFVNTKVGGVIISCKHKIIRKKEENKIVTQEMNRTRRTYWQYVFHSIRT
jgi:hypothetical protein